jgi:hypothetical protein
VLSLVLIVFAFNAFLYGTFDSSRTPVLALGIYNIFVTASILLSLKKSKHGVATVAFTALSIFSSIFLFVRANGFVQWINALTMTGSVFMLYFINTYDKITWKGLWFVKSILQLIPHTLNQLPSLLQKPKNSTSGKKFNVISIFKTIAITTVVVIFFVGLLSSADPVFASLIEDFMDEVIGRVIASLFIGAVAILFLTQKNHSDEENYWKLGFFSFSDLFVPAVALVTLFGAFLAVQANYLFGSEINLESFDLTYSEYVRKGFMELLVTAFFGGLLSYIIVMKGRLSKVGKYITQLKVVNAVLIAELFLMLGSALKRDIMYVEAYGLTRVRIVGGLFLFWLAGLLLLLLVMNLYKSFREKKFISGLAILSFIVVAGLNLFNIDQMVVNGAPEHHTYKDYFYVNNLSEDGYKGWAEAITAIQERSEVLLAKKSLSDEEKSQLAGDKLSLISIQEQRVELMKKYASEEWLTENLCEELRCQNGKISEYNLRDRGWKFFNFSEKRAYDELMSNQELYFNQVDATLEKIRTHQMQNGISLQKQERFFLNEFSYPFIDIDLDYYPEDFTTYDRPTYVGGNFNSSQISLMSQNTTSIQKLVDASCDNIGEEISLIAMMNSVYALRDDGNYRLQVWDDKSTRSIEAGYYSTASLPQSVRNNFAFGSSMDAHFGTVTLKRVLSFDSSSKGCSYTITNWQEVSYLD